MSASQPQEEESYFISMTDLMVGMLFIFIIMLMAFALNLKQQEEQLEDQKERLTQTDKAREQMLASMRDALAEKGLTVQILPESGVLRLPEEILFDSDRALLRGKGRKAVALLADSLAEVLPCYAGQDPGRCGDRAVGRLDSVFVEGHTDDTGTAARNWELSYKRARVVYQRLVVSRPELDLLRNDRGGAYGRGEKLLGVSGYASQRPAASCAGLARQGLRDCRAANRRIDIRFVMAVPVAERSAFERLLAVPRQSLQ